MGDTKFNIEYIAHLARLKLTDAEKEKFGAQLTTILNYMEKLRELNVADVEPTSHPMPLLNVMRTDIPQSGLNHSEAMQNAPLANNDLFIVPKIVE
ncbi:MAG: Asp-tRNA(Asn)/Glu-tRNA(Gln) amidotransferase subunit GatC [Verrucomicrobiae bacterium]|nr:Asp-tRNA(Asn)/Glu-tRNA(Gln) amidotransferase subunit GatC [Verrucomicrobiae bacterium]